METKLIVLKFLIMIFFMFIMEPPGNKQLFIMLEVFKKVVIQTNENKWVVSLAMLCIAHSDAKTH